MKISNRERYFLLVGGFIAAGILIWYVGTVSLSGLEDQSVDLDVKKRLLIRQKETLAQEESYRARVDNYRQRLEQNLAKLLPGDNPSIAGAELQKLLSDLAGRAGVEIIRKDIQREQKLQDNLVKVSVRIETNCNPEQLVQYIASVENHERYLTLEELAVNGFRMQRRYEIRPSMTVSGYIAVPEAKAEEQPGAGF